MSSAAPIVKTPGIWELFRGFSANGFLMFSQDGLYDIRTQKTVPLPPITGGMYYSYTRMSHDGRTMYGLYSANFASSWTYGMFWRDSWGTIHKYPMNSGWDLTDISSKGSHVMYSVLTGGHGVPEVNTTYVDGWPGFSMVSMLGLALSGDGQVGYIWKTLNGPIYRIVNGTSQTDIRQAGWTSPVVGDTNFDGSVAVGEDTNRAFIYRHGIGFTDLTPLTGQTTAGTASVSDDGKIVVGFAGADKVGFIYTPSGGVKTIANYLSTRGTDTTGWTFSYSAISGNGEALYGLGKFNGVNRYYHVWIGGKHVSIELDSEDVPRAGLSRARLALPRRHRSTESSIFLARIQT